MCQESMDLKWAIYIGFDHVYLDFVLKLIRFKQVIMKHGPAASVGEIAYA
jgi:hypothetical protein